MHSLAKPSQVKPNFQIFNKAKRGIKGFDWSVKIMCQVTLFQVMVLVYA
jgi:hypothetical protein